MIDCDINKEFDKPIVTWSDITVREYLGMSDEKRKEILESLEANTSEEYKAFLAQERAFVERWKQSLAPLMQKMEE